MVQLSQSPYRRLSTEKSMKLTRQQEDGSPPLLKTLPVVLSSANTQYQAYETYIDNGLICLKHKIRNIEKKKIKLQDYRDRMNNGEMLNPDQLEAVEKYDEILHNLEFAKELQKTFAALNQELLKAQKKILRRETMVKVEAEKKKLCTIFQVRYILKNMSQEHVQKDFRAGLNGAMCLTTSELGWLVKFSKLTCPKRDESLSLEDQMEQLSLHYWELLEASEKSVAGTTYKTLKDIMAKILNCGYFESIPAHHVHEKIDFQEDMKKPQAPTKTKADKTSEASVKCMLSNDIHPCEFLNRRYLPEGDCIKKELVKSKPWDSDYAGKPQALQPWNILTKEADPKMHQPIPVQNPPKQSRATNFIPKEKSWKESIDRKLPLPVQGPQSSVQGPQSSVQGPQSSVQGPQSSVQGPQSSVQGPQSSVPVMQTPKQRGVTNLIPKEVLRPKVEVPPKERRERQQKVESEVNHSAKSVNQADAEFCSTSSLPDDPLLRRQKLEDLMTKIQGTYHFMQESVLDFDTLSQNTTAISLQSPPSVPKDEKLTNQCGASLQSEQICLGTLTGSNDSLNTTEDTVFVSEMDLSTTEQVTEVGLSLPGETENHAPAKALYPSVVSETEQQNEDNSKACIPLSNDQQNSTSLAPSSSSLSPVSKGLAFQPPSANGSSGNIPSAPFQAVQTRNHYLASGNMQTAKNMMVFKVNAPLPPRKEFDMKDEPPYPVGYNQSYTTASTQTGPQSILQPTQIVEQASFVQESPSGPGAPEHVDGSRSQRRAKEDQDVTLPYQTDGTIQMSNGNASFYQAQGSNFGRSAAPYINCRGSVRGATRGGRGLVNSYRSPSGYKVGFDGYRGGPPSAINGNCSQLQYSTREYPGTQYVQRDGSYQQGYKRGTSGGQRPNSRGWSDSSQISSPERDHEVFHCGDSGQGDSRSLTPMDMPVTSQAATILPVHVYPLPQQMRVAFSAARTSNFAPGTLDQPIVFDLLLNNLGETFDIHIGRFACPVNGTYVFIFHMLKLAVNVPLYVNLMKNEEVLVSAYANDGAPDHETASNHAVLQLFQGDQIWLRLHRGAIYGSSWKYSTFSGYLLYQD
ncbi:caprin-2 isoform X1 [Pleurodeles waltl]|uniref:caprin-2 isoform X1 n=1 Tax=Pleurodeles waltl TaxID=8319 RepID=UPI0037097509